MEQGLTLFKKYIREIYDFPPEKLPVFTMCDSLSFRNQLVANNRKISIPNHTGLPVGNIQ